MTGVDRPPPPPADPAKPCAWGCTHSGSVGWRWVRAAGEWQRVCWLHAAPSKAADYIDDEAPRNDVADDHASDYATHQEELWT